MTGGFDRDEVRQDAQQGSMPKSSGQAGGGPSEADMAAPGGGSGSGGYGNDQNARNHQGQQQAGSGAGGAQSRGERFDELQGGGRGADSISLDQERDGISDELLEDPRDHQDRGESDSEAQV
jgi:hypothetical protein